MRRLSRDPRPGVADGLVAPTSWTRLAPNLAIGQHRERSCRRVVDDGPPADPSDREPSLSRSDHGSSTKPSMRLARMARESWLCTTSPVAPRLPAGPPSVERTFDADDHRLRASPTSIPSVEVQDAVVPQSGWSTGPRGYGYGATRSSSFRFGLPSGRWFRPSHRRTPERLG